MPTVLAWILHREAVESLWAGGLQPQEGYLATGTGLAIAETVPDRGRGEERG